MLLALVLLGMPALVLSSSAATTGFLEICKAADGPGVTGTFTFTVAGQGVEVPVGACSPAGRTAQVTVVAGDVSTQTVVTFANRVETGSLKVCKVP